MSEIENNELNSEDQKLVTLAKAAKARINSKDGACVRDTDGRTYSGASVKFGAKAFTALDLAIASALAAGAKKFEAVCQLGEEAINHDEIQLVLVEDGKVIICDAQGAVVSVIN